MASFMSFLKTTLILGFTLAVTAMSVYSASMSTYNYMVPADMGICALREYHMGFFARFTFPGNGLARLFIHYMYGRFHITQCQFNPNIPVSWINWIDTPARALLPFHKFCYILAKFQVDVMTPYYAKIAMMFFGFCLVVYISYHVLCWTTRLLATAVSMLSGAICKAAMKRKFLIPIAAMLMLSSIFGFRLAVFITAFGLALWFSIIAVHWFHVREAAKHRKAFDERWAKHEKKRTQKHVERKLMFSIVEIMLHLALVDQVVAAQILQINKDIVSGEMDANAAAQKFKTMIRKLTIQYHPDKNSGPTASDDMASINSIKDEMDKLFENPIEDLPFYKAASEFLTVAMEGQKLAAQKQAAQKQAAQEQAAQEQAAQEQANGQ